MVSSLSYKSTLWRGVSGIDICSKQSFRTISSGVTCSIHKHSIPHISQLIAIMSLPQRTVATPSATAAFDPTSVTTVLKDSAGRVAISNLTRNVPPEEVDSNSAPDGSIYHVVFTISHLTHDVFSEIEKIRVFGTYTSLKAAKAAAHKSMFDAGYEKEWFPDFISQSLEIKQSRIDNSRGLIVYAKAPDGTEYRVSILSSSNASHFEGNDEGKVNGQLYHVLRTTVYYSRDETGAIRENEVEASFTSQDQAKRFASKLLIQEGTGMTKESYAQYDESTTGEGDYGENTIVHAVGDNGDNILVRVLMEEELEAVRIAEAAARMS